MKVKHSLLVLLSTFLLVACNNYGSEVKDEAKVKELKQGVAEKVADLSTIEVDIKNTSASYDEEAKKNVTTKTEMTYKINSNGEAYLKSTATTGDEKSEGSVYLVKNETYQQVLYTDTDGEKLVYGYEGNELTFAFASLYFMMPNTYVEMFKNPVTLDFNTINNSEAAGREYDTTVKYYSKGEGNLTIVANVKVKGEIDKDEKEFAATTDFTITYDNNYLSSIKTDSVSNKKNKSHMEMRVSVKKEVKIELPSDWEQLINKSSGEEDAPSAE